MPASDIDADIEELSSPDRPWKVSEQKLLFRRFYVVVSSKICPRCTFVLINVIYKNIHILGAIPEVTLCVVHICKYVNCLKAHDGSNSFLGAC